MLEGPKGAVPRNTIGFRAEDYGQLAPTQCFDCSVVAGTVITDVHTQPTCLENIFERLPSQPRFVGSKGDDHIPSIGHGKLTAVRVTLQGRHALINEQQSALIRKVSRTRTVVCSTSNHGLVSSVAPDEENQHDCCRFLGPDKGASNAQMRQMSIFVHQSFCGASDQPCTCARKQEEVIGGKGQRRCGGGGGGGGDRTPLWRIC